MYPPARYIRWAMRNYGRARYDLATSGIPPVTEAELGPTPARPVPDGELRAAIARFNAVPVGEVMPALGTSHALWLAYAALLSPGDEVVVEHPIYEPLVHAALGQGATVSHFERLAEDGWEIDPDRVSAALTARTRVVAVTNLHNPSGARASAEVLLEVARRCAAQGAWLLVDEVYAPFDAMTDDGAVFRGSARPLAPNVVAVSSLTKCFGLGAGRIGWLLAPPDVVLAAEDAAIANIGGPPESHGRLAAHAFSRLDFLAERARGRLGDKRLRVAAWVAARPWLEWVAPREGLFGFVRVRGGHDLRPVVEAGLASHGVLVAPGEFFGDRASLRLAWSLDDRDLDEALSRLDAVLAPLAPHA